MAGAARGAFGSVAVWVLAGAIVVCGAAAARAATADLGLAIADDRDPVLTGSVVNYTAEVFNGGPEAAAAVVLTLTLPAAAAYQSYSTEAGFTCDVSALPVITCGVGALAATEYKGVTIHTTVTGPPGQSTVTVTGSVESGGDDDPNPGDNSASQTTTVGDGPADLRLNLYGPAPDDTPIQSEITYVLLVENAGDGVADQVTLRADVVGNGPLTILSVNPDVLQNRIGAVCDPLPPSVSDTAHQIVCTLPVPMERLGSASRSGRWMVEIRLLPYGPTMVRLDGFVTSLTTDPDGTNDVVTQSNRVAEVADLTVTLSVQPDQVAPGQEHAYSIVAFNDGPSRAEDVLVFAELPAGFVVTEILNSGGGSCIAGARLECGIGDLLPLESRTLVVRGFVKRAGDEGFFQCGATVTSDAFDHDVSDNYATIAVPLQVANFLLDPSFEFDPLGGVPWDVSDPDATATWDCATGSNSPCSLGLSAGSGVRKEVSQHRIFHGLRGDTVEVSGWSRAAGVPAGASVQTTVILFHANGTRTVKTLAHATGTHGWQKRTLSFVAPRSFYGVRYKLVFRAPAGDVWFDRAGVIVRPQ